jgi:phosphoadenosine phosphosulfate reductase
MELNKSNIEAINNSLAGKSAPEIIDFFLRKLGNKIIFGTSLGAEDQIITYFLSESKLDFEIFTLDTGRLFPETYDLINRSNNRFKINIKVMFPDFNEVESMVDKNGINLFYKSIDFRKECCQIRKLNPLSRALKQKSAWFTGLRREQSVTRNDMQIVEWDSNSNMIKVNPLIDWSEEVVWNFIREKKIPYNPLHDKGYPSIGCQPCTRAIEPGEDIRAGRWWWENPDTKECGLHAKH